MHTRGVPASRGHRHSHSYSGTAGQKAQLSNAYLELGRELASSQIKSVGNYTLGRVIGEGSFGKVRLAIHKLTSQRCAVKQIPRSSLASSMLTREIHHHRRLHHPNVLQLYEIVATENSIWLVSELCAGGELFDYLVEKGRLAEAEGKRIFGQLCLGVGYIHRQGVVHRDLKLENVLLDEKCNVKVADFGFGREFEQRRLMETYCGTTGYAAPEMLAGKKYTGEEVDVWSLGIILYALLTGSLPFDDDEEDVMKQKILAGDYEVPTWLSNESQELIANILRMEPRERLSIRQILGHDWFAKAPPVFSPSIGDYFQHADFLRQVIPEESPSSSPTAGALQTTLLPQTMLGPAADSQNLGHVSEPSTTESVASTASWHSAPSTAESDASHSGSTARTDTPLTSDEIEDAAPAQAVTYISADESHTGSNSGKMYTIPRNASQVTITRPDSRHSTRHPFRASPLLSGADSYSQPHRFPSPTFGMGETIPPSSPSLHMHAHSRTPSRTKRRSIGSTMSERLAIHQDHALPDFVTLLDDSSPQVFSSPGDQALLESMGLLGIDTGQMVHSVQSNACDSSSAIWWMLKTKADKREQEALESAGHAPAKSESMSSIAPSMHQIPRFKQESSPSTTAEPAAFGYHFEGVPEVNTTKAAEEESQEAMEVLRYGEASNSESPRKQRIQVPGSARASISAPLLVTRPEANATVVQNRSAEAIDTSAPASPSRTSAGAGRKASSSREVPKTGASPTTKPRSASVSTVSMLQRATTALGVRKEKFDDKNPPVVPSEPGRSTPSLLTAGFFARKVSSSSVSTASPEQSKGARSDGSPSAAPAIDLVQSEDSRTSPHDSPPLSSTPELSHVHCSSASPGGASTRSRETQESLHSCSLPNGSSNKLQASSNGSQTEDTGSYKPRGRGSKNIFSTFRMWFNDEKRKSRQHRPTSMAINNSPNKIAGGTVRKTYIHAPSPLQRPPIARMPSNTPSSAAVSRRNSLTSARHTSANEQPSPLLGYQHIRRRSDASRHSFGSGNGARTPTSERGHSRPASAQSGAPTALDAFALPRKRHTRAGSSSSAGSRHSTMISGSPVATYRRTPAVTQVRRISTPKGRYPPSRNASNNSSARSASSCRSSLSVPLEGEETIMEEENENLEDSVEVERNKALRKLSGNAVVPDDAPQALTEAAVAAVDALSEDNTTAPRVHRHSSNEHSHGHRHNRHHHNRHHSSTSAHGPAVFAAHKVVNPFGTPNGSHFSSHPHGRNKRDSDRPKLRDIFKSKSSEGDDGWVDEEEGLYSGGFGQSSSRSTSSTPALEGHTPTVQRTNPHPLKEEFRGASSVPMLGEGRYAGVSRTECAPPTFGGSRPRQTVKGPSFKQTATVVEEEEEEEN